jgi:hypothetical protein
LPVEGGDVEAEQGREDDDRDREQHGREHEEGAQAPLAAAQHLLDAERDREGEIGVEDRPPIGEADRGRAVHMQGLHEQHGREGERGEEEEAASGQSAAGRRAAGRGLHRDA